MTSFPAVLPEEARKLAAMSQDLEASAPRPVTGQAAMGTPSAIMGTLSGQMLQLEDPQQGEIRLLDLVIGMARTARFCGQTSRQVSVLAHSVEVARVRARGFGHDPKVLAHASQLELQVIYQGLMHDASEALICDIPSPLKRMNDMAGYARIEKQLLRTVGDKFRVCLHDMDPLVHTADRAVLVREARAYCPNARWAGEPQAMHHGACYGPLPTEVDAFSELMTEILQHISPQQPGQGGQGPEGLLAEDQAWKKGCLAELALIRRMIQSGEIA